MGDVDFSVKENYFLFLFDILVRFMYKYVIFFMIKMFHYFLHLINSNKFNQTYFFLYSFDLNVKRNCICYISNEIKT